MSDTVDLGTISASVELKLAGLQAGVGKASGLISGLAAAAEQQAARIKKSMDAAAASVSAFEGKAEKLAASTAGQRIAGSMTLAGAGVAAGFGLAIKAASDFDATINHVANNTTMKAGEIDVMRTTILRLSKESGAALDDLADGWMHVSNFGFQAAENMVILREAMKSAVSTGGKVGATADILAKSLHEFGMGASMASKAMNVMHLAAAEGNMTLEQFDAVAGPAFSAAAALGAGFTETAAAISALTRHGYDAAEAVTQVKDVFSHLIQGSKSTKEELARLSAVTGINLTQDFTAAGLKARGLYGVFLDLAMATRGHADEVYKLIPAMRGGQGAMVLASTGAADYKNVLLDMNQAVAGKLDPSTQDYNRTLGTTKNKAQRARAEFEQLKINLGEDLIPAFNDGATAATKFLDQLNAMPDAKRKSVESFVAIAGAISLVTGGLMSALKFAAELKIALAGAGWLSGAGAGGGLLGSAGLAGLAGRMGLMSGGLGYGGVSGTAGLGGNLLGGAVLAAPAIFGGYMANKIMGAQNDGYNAEQRGNGAADLSPYVDRVAALRKQEKAAPNDPKIKGELAEALAALRQMSGANSRVRQAAAGNSLTEAMAKHIGQATGVQCGQAVSNALKVNGISVAVSRLAQAAIKNNALVKLDGAGHLPPGTVVFFPGKQGTKNIGTDPTEHFGMMGGISPTGFQPVLESTTAGGHGRHYRGDRGLAQVAAGHGGQYYAFDAPANRKAADGLPGVNRMHGPAPLTDAQKEKIKDQSTLLQDEKDQLYEATHKDFDNRRYNAKRGLEKADSDPAATGDSKAIAQKTYQASLAQIAKDEAAAQKENNAKLAQLLEEKKQKQEQAWAEEYKAGTITANQYQYLLDTRLAHYAKFSDRWAEINQKLAGVKGQRQDALDAQAAGAAAGHKRGHEMGDLSLDMQDSIDAVSEDPIEYEFNKKRGGADKRYRERQEAIQAKTGLGPDEIGPALQGTPTTGPASPTSLYTQAAQEHKVALAQIQADEDKAIAEKAQSDKDKADRAIEESSRAAEKLRQEAEETTRFEYEQGMISLADYQKILKAKLGALEAANQKWVNADHTILNPDWMKAKADYDSSLGLKKQKPGADPFSFLGDGMKTDVGKGLEDALDGQGKKLHSLKAEVKSWEDAAIKAIKHVAVMWAMSSMFGSKFGGGFNFGGSGKKDGSDAAGLALGALGSNSLGGKSAGSGLTVPGVHFLGGGAGHGLSGNLLRALPQIGMLGGLAGVHGINGPVGGKTSGLGGAMDIASLAASFLPGGGLLAKSLKGGGLLGGIGKLFHFASGGIVPGVGFHDSVHAVLTPGERVLTKEQQGMGGGHSIVINHHGDNNNAGDVEQMHEGWSWQIAQQLATAVPGN